MRKLTLLTAIATLCLTAGTMIGAGPDHDMPNAALRYWKVWATVTPEAIQTIQDVSLKDITSPNWTPSDKVIQAIHAFNFGLFIKAASMPTCDFGTDADEDGPLTLMPHLGPMRASVKALMIDARHSMMRNDFDGAAQRIAAGYRASLHISRDPVLISGLVSAACFQMTDEMLSHILLHHTLTDEQRAAIREALVGFDDQDPFSLRVDLNTEGHEFIAWIRKQIESGSTDALNDTFSALGLSQEDLQKSQHLVADKSAALRDLEKLSRYYEVALTLWSQPDASQSLADLQKTASEGAFGEFGKLFAPPLDRVHKQYLESANLIRTAKKRVGA